MGWKDSHNKSIKIFIENLVKLREERGMTQHDLAIASGLTRRVVGGYERGESMPRLISIYALSKGLGVEVQDLFPKNGKIWVNKEGFEEMHKILSNILNETERLTELNALLDPFPPEVPDTHEE